MYDQKPGISFHCAYGEFHDVTYLLNEFRLSLLSVAKTNKVSRFPIIPPIPTANIPIPEIQKSNFINISLSLRVLM